MQCKTTLFILTNNIPLVCRYEYTVEIDFESEIKQLLPEENFISASDDKPSNSSPVKTTKQVKAFIHRHVVLILHDACHCGPS